MWSDNDTDGDTEVWIIIIFIYWILLEWQVGNSTSSNKISTCTWYWVPFLARYCYLSVYYVYAEA